MRWIVQITILMGLASTTTPAWSVETITLKQFLGEAASQNLSLKAETAAADATDQAATGIALPAPMGGITQMTDQSGKGSGFEVSQTIPFPTKLTNDHSARRFDAEAQKAIKQSREKEILSDAKLLYFKLWQSQERVKLLLEKKSAIEQHIKLSTASARSDSFLKIHIIKTESDLDLLENEITQAEQENKEVQIQSALILNRDPKTFKPVAEATTLSSLPKEDSLLTPYSIEAKMFELESLRSRERAAKSEWLPDFNLRYKEFNGTDMAPKYSEIMVGATLPFVFFWQPNAQANKASAERLKAETLFSYEKRKVEASRATLYSKAQSLKKQVEQLNDKLIPRAERRTRLVHNIAPRDMETLQDHRETMEALPDLKLKNLELRTQYEEVVAELEKYSSEGTK